MAASGLDPSTIFPFLLDDFQLEAIDALDQGHSVVVSAPTVSYTHLTLPTIVSV